MPSQGAAPLLGLRTNQQLLVSTQMPPAGRPTAEGLKMPAPGRPITATEAEVDRESHGRGIEHMALHRTNSDGMLGDGRPRYNHGIQRHDITRRTLRKKQGFVRPNTPACAFADLGEVPDVVADPAEAGPSPEVSDKAGKGSGYLVGVLYVVMSTVFFSFAAVLVKLNTSMPSVETGTCRSVYSLVLGSMLATMVYGKGPLPFRAGGTIMAFLIGRGFVDFCASNLFYFGCTKIGLGLATVILFTNPFWTALLARVWLGEPYELTDFLLACTAFAGVVISAWPSLSQGVAGVSPMAILIVLPAPIFQALTYCFIKRIAGHVHFMQMTVAYGVNGIFLGPLIMTYGSMADQPLAKPAPLEVLEDPHSMMLGLGVALLGMAAQVFLNLGCARVEASVAAAIRTIDIPLALVFERIVFGVQAEWISIVGASLVFTMSMLTTYLKQLKANKAEDARDALLDEDEEAQRARP